MQIGFSLGHGGLPPRPVPTGLRATRAPRLTGLPRRGERLTVDPGDWTGDGLIAFDYAWLADAAAIAGEMVSAYLIRTGDGGRALRCIVTARDRIGRRSLTTAPVVVPRGWSLAGGAGHIRLDAMPAVALPVARSEAGHIIISG